MNYSEALQYLESLIDLSRIPNLTYTPEKFDLGRMKQILALMGNPQSKVPIIHIAGTKGKGSTAALLAGVLEAAGYRTGLFTSPYLSDFCEQMQVNRKPIPQAEMASQIEAVIPLTRQVKNITSFETATAVAFRFFFEQECDFAVVEAGFGGKNDATNVVDPILSIITSISYDHMSLLGDTIVDIALHKAGIIKSGKPVILAPQVFTEASQIVTLEASKKSARVIIVDDEIECTPTNHSLNGQRFNAKFKQDNSPYNREYLLSLLGEHQMKNAATVLCAVRELSKMGYTISTQDTTTGLAKTEWPCRFEVVSREPLIVLDSAHNADSAQKLRQTITEYLPGKVILLVFGCNKDKEIMEIFKELLPICGRVIFTKTKHPRAADPLKLVELGKGWPNSFEISEHIADAVQKAITMADKRTAIVVAGSVFLAAAAREVIIKP